MSNIMLALGFGIVVASVVGIAAVGFTMQFGVSRLFNVSFGAVMTVCAYVAYYIDVVLHTNLWVGMVGGGVAGVVLSVATERFIFQPFKDHGARLFTVVMVSFALDLLLQNVLIVIAGSGFYSYDVAAGRIWKIAGMEFTFVQFVLIGIGAVGMLGFHLLLRNTQLGRAIRAAACEPDLASCVGLNVRRTSTIAWALSGLFAGLGGVALAVNTSAFSPTTGDTFAFIVFAAAVVGGLGQPYGAMLGGLIVGVLSQEVAIYVPVLQYVIVFAILVAILVVRPAGLVVIGGRGRKDVAPS